MAAGDDWHPGDLIRRSFLSMSMRERIGFGRQRISRWAAGLFLLVTGCLRTRRRYGHIEIARRAGANQVGT